MFLAQFIHERELSFLKAVDLFVDTVFLKPYLQMILVRNSTANFCNVETFSVRDSKIAAQEM